MNNFKTWAKAAGIRAARTMAQAFAAAIGTSAFVSDVSWGVVASTTIMAGIASIATSVATKLPEIEE